MGFDSIWHWLILLLVVLLVFGTSKLRNAGSDIGAAVRNFKKAVKEDADAGQDAKAGGGERLQADAPAPDAAPDATKDATKDAAKPRDHAP